jgi:DNA polymerase-3 subunit epsilon
VTPLHRLARTRPRTALARTYAQARRPAGGTPWREAPWCAVDLELSGLDPDRHEIIAYGAVPIRDGRVLIRGAVAGLARPTRPLTESSIRIHGIRAADLADAPRLAEALEPLLAAMTGHVLVAHSAGVERGFLGPALRAQGLRLRGPVVDTAVLGRLWLHERDGRAPSHLALGDLAAALGLPAERPHAALSDALTTAQSFVALASHLNAMRPETVRSLTGAQSRLQSVLSYMGR